MRATKPLHGEKTVFPTNGVKKTASPHANECSWTPTLACTKINSKQTKDMNVQAEMMKLLEGNIGGKLCDIGFGDDFLDIIPKAKATNEKNR